MNIKKKIQKILFHFLLLSCSSSIQAVEFEDDFDSFLDNADVNAFLDANEFTFVRKSFDPPGIITILEEMGITSILEENFYLRTNPLNKRNIIDLPNGLFDKTYYYNNWVFGVELFFNKTDRSYFTRKCDAISSYLALAEESFLQKLDAAAKNIEELEVGDFDFDPLDVITLFINGTIQERRIGALIHGQKTIRDINIAFKLPFYWLERNFWFTEKEQQAIEDELGTTTAEEQEKMQELHMISDKLGFGDTRIMVDYPITTSEKFSSCIGFLTTLPFAWAPAKGIMGNKFEDQRLGHNADFKEMTGYHLDELFTLATGTDDQKQEAFNILTKLGYNAIDHLAANLLDTKIGNDRHFGLGILFKSITPLTTLIKRLRGSVAENIVWKSFISLEYLFPSREKRFFTETVDERLLNVVKSTFNDDDKAQQNMEFIESQMIDKLFPFVYEARVHPGVVFRWTGKATYESERFGIHIGTDTWIKSPEKLYNIEAPKNQRDRLNIEKAQRLLAYQWKIIGSLFYKSEREKRNWIFSLNGDYSWSTSGIGADYTLSLNFEVEF